MKCIVVSASSDIGFSLCHNWITAGYQVAGTYRTASIQSEELLKLGVSLIPCDLANITDIHQTSDAMHNMCNEWDTLVFATGSQLPIGMFAECTIDEWVKSISVNFINQFAMLHKLLPFRNKKSKLGASVLFFAGGGTNGSVPRYSAYTISKIACIKMCELLDAEMPDVRFSIIGPGWVKTKIHQQTLESGSKLAGANFQKTQEMLEKGEFVPMEKVVSHCDWLLLQPKNIIGGRNFSTAHDLWGTQELATALENDPNMYKLRRHGNNWDK